MNKLINEININLNLNLSIENLRESILEIKKDLTIQLVKSLNENYFTVFTSIESNESEEYEVLKNFFLECNSLYSQWTESKRIYEDKTLRAIEEKQNIGITFLSEEEIQNINEAFYDEKQNIYESIEFLSSQKLIDKLVRKHSRAILKENIHHIL